MLGFPYLNIKKVYWFLVFVCSVSCLSVFVCLVFWFYGRMVVWFYGFMVSWFHGFMVIWFYGVMVLWFLGFTNLPDFHFKTLLGGSSGFVGPRLFDNCRNCGSPQF